MPGDPSAIRSSPNGTPRRDTPIRTLDRHPARRHPV